MSEPIVVSYGFDRRLFPRAIMAFWYSAVPRPSASFRVIFWLVLWLCALGIAIAIGATDYPAWKAWAWVAGILVGWMILLQQVRLNKFYSVLSEHWDRTGDMIARFDHRGLEIHQSGARMQFEWTAVDSVVRARGGTVFRIGMTMIAIPDHVLPDGMKGREFREKLKSWRDG